MGIEGDCVGSGSGFIYAQQNLNQYIRLGKKDSFGILSYPQRLNTVAKILTKRNASTIPVLYQYPPFSTSYPLRE